MMLAIGVLGVRVSGAQTAAVSLPVIVADFNHDGIPDALVPSSSNATATLALGTVPYGSFGAARAVTFPAACTSFVADAGNAGSLVAGDFNGDGFADLMFTCTTDPQGDTLTGVMLGFGDGTFAPAVTLTTAYADGTVLGDFNQDGKLDAVVIAYPNGIYLTNNQRPAILFFAGNGDGTFAAPVSSPLGSSATFQTGNFILGSPVAADVNGDGYPDIVLNAAYGYTSDTNNGATLTLSVFGNRKDGTFGATAQALRIPDATAVVGTYPASNDLKVVAGSFTGPVAIDFIVPDAGSTQGYFLVKNTSTATAYSFATPVKTSYPGLIAASSGTFTGGGATDLVVANGTQLVVLTNDGTGNFLPSYATLTVPSTSSLFAVADANLDGYADLYTASQGSTLGLKVNLVNGSATAKSQPFSLTPGIKAVSATWAGNVLFTGSTANNSQTVNGAPSVTTLVSSKNPSIVGGSVTFTAAVAPASALTTLPTGTVVFSDGTTALATVTLDTNGRAAFTTTGLSVATHTIAAAYSGDSFYASSGQTLSQVVNRPPQVPPTLTWPTPAAITFGTALSGTQLDATATGATGVTVPGVFVYTPAAGTVLNAGLQTLSVSFTPTDLSAYTIATFTVPLTILPATPATALTLTSGGAAVSTVPAGSVVTLTASVAAGTQPVPLGQVRFCDAAATYCTDIHLLGTAQLTSAGTAVLRFVPGIGAHSYKAVFVGTGNDVGSASAAAALAVTGIFGTTTTIAQSGTVGNYTLTATTVGVTAASAPTGTVSFLDGSNGNSVLGTASTGVGTSTFALAKAASLPTGTSPGQTVTGDFNGDGKADIIQQDSQGITLLLGNGDGTFRAGPSIALSYIPSAIVVGDFNGDGRADLAVATYNIVLNVFSGTVNILLGNGDGTFTAAPNPSSVTGAQAMAVGDFNGDGKADLVVANTFGNESFARFGSTHATILLGNGDGTFTPAPSVVTGSRPASVTVGDFNGDGKVDLAFCNFLDSTVSILLGNGDGSFVSTPISPATGTQPQSIVSADLNGDGKADLAIANAGTAAVTILLGNGDGTFAASLSPTAGAGLDIEAADFNKDGRVDLAFLDYTNNVLSVLVGKGDGTFAQGPTSAVGTAVQSIAVADFTGDGVPDSTVADTGSNTVSIFLTNLSHTVQATASGVSPLGAGAHQVVASYPGDGVYAASVSAPTSLTGQTFTPVLTWTPAVATIPYGTPLGPQQLNATATSLTGAVLPGVFLYTPAAGTVLQAGTQTLSVTFTPTGTTYVPVSQNVTITITPIQPKIAWPTPAGVAYGTPLSGTQLNATVTGLGTTPLAGVLTYTPPAGTVPAPGTQTLSVRFVPTDAVDYTTATASVSLNVSALVLSSITPSIARIGDPATLITLTGSGFVSTSLVRVNGGPIPTTYVTGTTLTAIVPASSFATAGTLQIAVADPTISAVSAAQPLTVIAPNPSVTLTGPSTTAPGSQPALTLGIVNPYPLPLTATFTLSFASVGSAPVDDPAIQFAAGGRTLSFVIPANSTVVPPIQLQAGTDAGTITIPVTLTTSGINVTPTGLAPAVIVVPASVPTLSTTTLTRGTGTISVAIHGFSNTREVTTATFHFVAAPGATLATPDISAPVGTVFGTWFGSSQSVPFGSTFTYTQIFSVSDDPKNIGSIQVTLTNGVGPSALSAAQ